MERLDRFARFQQEVSACLWKICSACAWGRENSENVLPLSLRVHVNLVVSSSQDGWYDPRIAKPATSAPTFVCACVAKIFSLGRKSVC
jgi:hypothetical protein